MDVRCQASGDNHEVVARVGDVPEATSLPPLPLLTREVRDFMQVSGVCTWTGGSCHQGPASLQVRRSIHPPANLTLAGARSGPRHRPPLNPAAPTPHSRGDVPLNICQAEGGGDSWPKCHSREPMERKRGPADMNENSPAAPSCLPTCPSWPGGWAGG